MICRDGIVGAAGRAASVNHRQPSLQMLIVVARKTLLFYHGRAPKGSKTDWVMHEYRMMEGSHEQSSNHSKVIYEIRCA